jgi:hypothetical protein
MPKYVSTAISLVFVEKNSTIPRVMHSQNDEDGMLENSLFPLIYDIISLTK